MKRIPESELMEEDDQARAYAEADFAEPHNNFIFIFKDIFPNQDANGYVLDLGCGPGDISIQFAKAYSNCFVHGIDGSEAMLHYGRQALENLPEIADRVKLYNTFYPQNLCHSQSYDAIICNSLLHHLPDPQTLWNTIKLYAKKEAPLFVMDLKRPNSIYEARKLTETYVSNKPEILQRDFYNSLLASFEINEIKAHLKIAGLEQLSVKQTSDRHVLIYGKIC